MKSFQFYQIKEFPTLEIGKPVCNQVQRSFYGDGEGTTTCIELKNMRHEGTIDLVHIATEVEYNTCGYIDREYEGERKRFEFTSFKHPVDFFAYLDTTRKILILPQPKRVCKGVFTNLNTINTISLVEMIVDFQKAGPKCDEYLGAWFRGVSTRVNAAGLAGNQIQDDNYFKRLMKDGELSNVTVPWGFSGAIHRVMITKSGALVLQQEYRDNQTLELNIVADVFDKLLSLVWSPKPSRRNKRDADISVEP